MGLKPDAVIQSKPWTFSHMKQQLGYFSQTQEPWILARRSNLGLETRFQDLDLHSVLKPADPELRCEPDSEPSALEKIIKLIFFIMITNFTSKTLHQTLHGIWKNISCFRFRFWQKTDKKRCTNNCVVSRVKRLSLPSFRGWSRGFNFRIWFGKQKNAVSAKISN